MESWSKSLRPFSPYSYQQDMFSFRTELDHNQVGVASLLPLATMEGAETWVAAIIAYILLQVRNRETLLLPLGMTVRPSILG